MKCFAVFGDPVSHSLSPRIHNLALLGLGLNGFYSRINLKDGFKLIEIFNKLNLDGANVTVPFKEIALDSCDFVDETARSIGSLNTLVRKNNKIYGYNTDALGFLLSLQEFMGDEFQNVKNALILGAGGTSKALSYILKKNGIETDILNRSDRSLEFSKLGGVRFFTPQNFKVTKYDLVVNSTSAGLSDDELPVDISLLNKIFASSKFAFDVIYNKLTPFLKVAKDNSLKCSDGRDMLLFQAVLSFNLFFSNQFQNGLIKAFMQEAFLLS